MNEEKKVVIIDIVRSDDLGLKIIVVRDINTEKSFAVITEVNPIGIAFENNIEIGDILLSMNGVDIQNYKTLNELVADESQKNDGSKIQLKIQKKGCLSIPGLLNASLNSPCSNLCKVWEESTCKMDQYKENVKSLNQTKTNHEKMKTSIFSSYNSAVPQLKKRSVGNIEETILDRDSIQFNLPKYKYHQKAIPMKRKDNNQKTTLRPKKSFQGHVIQPPQPMFIKRKNQPQMTKQTNIHNPKLSKSLTDLSFSSDKAYSNDNSQIPSESSSQSKDSVNETPNNYIPKCPANKPRVNNIFKRLDSSQSRSKSSDLITMDSKTDFERLKPDPTPLNQWRVGNKFQKHNQR